MGHSSSAAKGAPKENLSAAPSPERTAGPSDSKVSQHAGQEQHPQEQQQEGSERAAPPELQQPAGAATEDDPVRPSKSVSAQKLAAVLSQAAEQEADAPDDTTDSDDDTAPGEASQLGAWAAELDAQNNKHLTGAPLAGPPTAAGEGKKLTILHFNDVYNIEGASREPVGGAARMASKVKSFKDRQPLVLFSGDAFNPSLMSSITLGKQMVPVLNEIGVSVACVGNHDLDYGTANLIKLVKQCRFPWLMANVRDRTTGAPYAGAGSTFMLEWQGIKVGLVGLVEDGWLETLGAVNTAELQYEDFVTVGRDLARQLKARGARLLIALTHMREPNDRKLAAEVPEFHMVLGGHDHHYVSEYVEPNYNLLVKSGTDFRDLTEVSVLFPADGSSPEITYTRHPITAALPPDPATDEIVQQYMAIMGAKMDEPLVACITDMDGRFASVRAVETNLGNLVADVWRKASNADIAILNSGSLRSDQLHQAGTLLMKDFVAILPMIDETVVVQALGEQVIRALENGVSAWPTLEGRFPQVSGVTFEFDPSQPPGQRIVPGSVMFTGDDATGSTAVPLDERRLYRVAVKEYLAKGKDGFDVFLECPILVDAETAPVLPTCMRNHFRQLKVLNALRSNKISAASAARKWSHLSKESSRLNGSDTQAATPPPSHPPDSSARVSPSLSGVVGAVRAATSSLSGAAGQQQQEQALEQVVLPPPTWARDVHGMLARFSSPQLEGEVLQGHGLAVTHPHTGKLVIAPVVEGRIVNVRQRQQQP